MKFKFSTPVITEVYVAYFQESKEQENLSRVLVHVGVEISWVNGTYNEQKRKREGKKKHKYLKLRETSTNE